MKSNSIDMLMSKKIREVRDIVVDHENRIDTLENTGSSNHNSLLGIQGGDTNEYYHLTSANYTDVTGFDFSGTETSIQNISGSSLGVSTTFTGNVLASNITSTNSTDISTALSRTTQLSYNSDVTTLTGSSGNTFVINNSKSTSSNIIECFAPNLVSAEKSTIKLGKSNDNNNVAEIQYSWNTTENDRFLSMGFYGNNDLFKMYPNRFTMTKPLTITGDVTNENTSLDTLNLRGVNSELPHGFVNRTDSTISASNGTFTIQPAVTSYSYYYKSNRYDITNSQQVQYYSTPPSVTTTYFIYFDDNVLTSSTLAWSIRNTVPIAYVIYISNTGANVMADERHGINMSTLTHEYLHLTRGTVYESGLALANYTLNSDSGTDYTVSAGVIYDEDIRISISEKTTDFKLLYRLGVDGVWTLYETNRLYNDGTNPAYNQYTGSTWQMTTLTTNGVFFNYYLFATNLNSTFNIIIIPGQETYTSSAAAIGESVRSLQLGSLPIQEIAPIVKITYDRRNTYGTGNYKSRIVNVEAIVSQSVTITQGVANHNSLSGLQGSTPNEYYHLSQSEFTNLQNIDSSILDTSTTFTGNVLASNITSTNSTDISTALTRTQNVSGSILDTSTTFIGNVLASNLAFDNETRLSTVENNTEHLEGLEMFTTLTVNNAKSLVESYYINPPAGGARYIDIAASSTYQIIGAFSTGNIYYSSNDGVNWTLLTTLTNVHCITYNSSDGYFYCYANNTANFRKISNSDLSVTSDTTTTLSGASHVEYYSSMNRFIAFTTSSPYGYYSSDGKAWTACSGLNATYYTSTYSYLDVRVRSLSIDRTKYAITQDLVTWYEYNTSLSSGSTYYSPAYSPLANILMCASNSSTSYVIFRNNTWTSYTADSNLSLIFYDNVSRLFFMIHNNGTIKYSSGDNTWTTMTQTFPTNDYYRGEIVNNEYMYLFDESTSILRMTPSSISKSININGDLVVNNVNASSLNNMSLSTSRSWFNRYLSIASNGLIEIGRYLDWHFNDDLSVDRTSRMTCESTGNVVFDHIFSASNITTTNSTDISTSLTRTQNMTSTTDESSFDHKLIVTGTPTSGLTANDSANKRIVLNSDPGTNYIAMELHAGKQTGTRYAYIDLATTDNLDFDFRIIRASNLTYINMDKGTGSNVNELRVSNMDLNVPNNYVTANSYNMANASGNFGGYFQVALGNLLFPVGSRIIRSTNTAPPSPPYVGTWVLNDTVSGNGGSTQYIYQRTA